MFCKQQPSKIFIQLNIFLSVYLSISNQYLIYIYIYTFQKKLDAVLYNEAVFVLFVATLDFNKTT